MHPPHIAFPVNEDDVWRRERRREREEGRLGRLRRGFPSQGIHRHHSKEDSKVVLSQNQRLPTHWKILGYEEVCFSLENARGFFLSPNISSRHIFAFLLRFCIMHEKNLMHLLHGAIFWFHGFFSERKTQVENTLWAYRQKSR